MVFHSIEDHSLGYGFKGLCWMELSLMSKDFGNDKGIGDGRKSDGICDKDGKTHERIQRGNQVR